MWTKNYNNRIRALAGIKYYGENQLSHGGYPKGITKDIPSGIPKVPREVTSELVLNGKGEQSTLSKATIDAKYKE